MTVDYFIEIFHLKAGKTIIVTIFLSVFYDKNKYVDETFERKLPKHPDHQDSYLLRYSQ